MKKPDRGVADPGIPDTAPDEDYDQCRCMHIQRPPCGWCTDGTPDE